MQFSVGDIKDSLRRSILAVCYTLKIQDEQVEQLGTWVVKRCTLKVQHMGEESGFLWQDQWGSGGEGACIEAGVHLWFSPLWGHSLIHPTIEKRKKASVRHTYSCQGEQFQGIFPQGSAVVARAENFRWFLYPPLLTPLFFFNYLADFFAAKY